MIELHHKRIRQLSKMFNLQWLVDQAEFFAGSQDGLSQQELVRLHADMEKAVDCIKHGVSFLDADLVRPTF